MALQHLLILIIVVLVGMCAQFVLILLLLVQLDYVHLFVHQDLQIVIVLLPMAVK